MFGNIECIKYKGLTMSQVDFTLKDVQKIVDSTVSSSEKRVITHLTAHMDMRFQETHIATAEVISAVNDHMDERFSDIDGRLNGMDKRFDVIDEGFDEVLLSTAA